MNAPPEVIPGFFQSLVQAIRSQDPNQLHLLFQFHFAVPLPQGVQTFIASLRTVPLLPSLLLVVG